MPAFTSSLDIGNRALQHCGASRISSFTEISENASEISSVYDKLREAELRRSIWTFATKRAVLRAIDTNTMLLDPSLWSSTVTYFRGCIVADENDNLWISTIPNNLGNDPLLTSLWEPYFGSMAVPVYDTSGTTAYQAGELVYTDPGDGTYRVYLSLISANLDVPATATAWSATATYSKNQVVTYSSVAYMSLIDLNLNNQPNLAPALWAIGTTYSAGQQVGGSDGLIYQSVGNGNIGHNPITDGGVHWTDTGVLNPWTTVFTGGAGSLNWLEIGGAEFPSGVALTTLNLIYPIGAGPVSQNSTANVYRLPNAYLRRAPQNPKHATPVLGGPSGDTFNDWRFENGYLITCDSGPIVLRFVADVTDVRRMDALFCEGLAARIGFEVCEKLTQSTVKKGTIAKTYGQWISDARQVDAIEEGYTDPPDDDWLSVRY